MRAAGIRALGGQVDELDLADPRMPSDEEVLIEVRAAGIGNWDDLVRTGAWDVGIRSPMALGVEATGTVRAVGRGVARFVPGDAVLVHGTPLRYQGAWAELFLASAADTAAKPPELDWIVAAALPVPLLTAVQVVAWLGSQPGDAMLVHGAGGVTGGLIVAMAAATGARVVATSSTRAVERVRGYGAIETLDYRDPAWRAQARRAVPTGFAAVANAARGEAPGLLTLVAGGGKLATITGDPPPSERGIAVMDIYVAPDGPALEAAAADLAARGLGVPIAGTCGLAGAADALERVVHGGAGGAFVVLPAG